MSLVKKIISLIPMPTAYAHCDIPCKIYDPHASQVAAHTVIRMTQMLIESEKLDDGAEREHHIARLTSVKEEHTEQVKREVRVIWGDYFKDEQIQKIPKVHELVHSIMLQSSIARQKIDIDEANKLLSLVQEFAEVFYLAKGVASQRVPSTFPTEGEIVIQK